MRRIERSAITLSSSTASTRPFRRSSYGCTSSSYEIAATPCSRSAASSRSYAVVPPSVAMRRPRQIRERAEARRVGGAHREHLAKLVVRQRHGERRATRRRVLDAVERDVEVAARGGLVERCERDLDELRRATELLRDQLGDLDVEALHSLGMLRVGFDVRRAAFRIPCPPKRRRLLSSTFARRERKRDDDRGRERHEPSGRSPSGRRSSE